VCARALARVFVCVCKICTHVYMCVGIWLGGQGDMEWAREADRSKQETINAKAKQEMREGCPD